MKYDPLLDHLVEVNRDAKSKRESWWFLAAAILAGALLGWLLIQSCAEQINPGPPPRVKQMRAIA